MGDAVLVGPPGRLGMLLAACGFDAAMPGLVPTARSVAALGAEADALWRAFAVRELRLPVELSVEGIEQHLAAIPVHQHQALYDRHVAASRLHWAAVRAAAGEPQDEATE